jgi:hypothetical protein
MKIYKITEDEKVYFFEPCAPKPWDECPAFEKRAAAGDENLAGRGAY